MWRSGLLCKDRTESGSGVRTELVPFLDLTYHTAAYVSLLQAMEPWPVVAWVLMLAFIADWLQTVKSRDFTEKDIIFLHPSTTPYPGGFKCFTCEEAADNFECNRWAPDLYCAKESKYCYTSHKLDWGGNTLSVTKRCVALEDCLDIGCSERDYEGNRVCVACCEGNICNLPLPQNETDAIFATTSPLSGGQRTTPHPTVPLSFLMPTLFIFSHG